MNYWKRMLFIVLTLIVIHLSPCVSQDSPQKNVDLFGEKYSAVLTKYVDSKGMVNYRNLKKDRNGIAEVATALFGVGKNEYDLLSDNEKIAFLINTYNFLTLKVIVDNYPFKPSFFSSLRFPKNSIRQISGVWDEIQFTVMGQKMTLNHIEHDILRVEFDEPRIHIALVCAAMGCPPLRNEPYSASKLDKQFEDQIRRFINNPLKFRIDKDKKRVFLSSIFKWFGEDFIQRYGTNDAFRDHDESEGAVLNYFAQYLSPLEYDFLLTESYDISYLDYDWSLNEQK